MPDIVFRDQFKLALPGEEELKEFKDSFNSTSLSKKLTVSLDATHAGITNLNYRYYIPAMMEEGVSGLSDGKPRPILKHHQRDGDPVGKVVGAEYVPTLSEEVLAVAPEVNDLVAPDVPLKKRVRAAKKFIKRGIAANKDWKGLGFARLKADILDEETIKQIETGLFDSVSIGFTSDHAFCSICGADWLDEDDGFCEHFPPGRIYENEDGEKERQYLIPGKMEIGECSLVNFDADPHTSIIIEGSGFGDAEKDAVKQEMLFDCNAQWCVQDFKKEDSGMKLTIKDKTIELSDREAEVFKAIKKKFASDDDSYVVEAMKEILSDLKDEEKTDDEKVMSAYEDKRAKDQEIISYDAFEKELQKMVDEELLSKEELEDAKLSTKKRKKLPDSVFCGPDRSFPVNDCAHCTAARRLIGRYKGPGSKDKIEACIERKCKALGCDKEEKKGDSREEPCLDCELQKMSDEDLKNRFHSTEAELIKRKLVVDRPCSQCADNQKKAADALEKAAEIESKFEDAEATVAVLRDEYRLCSADMKVVVNDSIETQQQMDELKKEYASLLAVLSKKEDSLSKAVERFEDAEDFDKEYKNLVDSFDLDDFVLKFSSGMASDPKGRVENPVRNQDGDNNQRPEGLSKSALAVIDRIKEMLKDGKEQAARGLFIKMQSMDVLGEETRFEDLFNSEDADK